MHKLTKALCVLGLFCGTLSTPMLLLADDSFGAPQISCGTVGNKPCSKGGETVKAIDKGKDKKWGCKGKRLYFTPHKGGQCWSCPKGYKRTVKPIHKKTNACSKGLGKKNKAKSKFVRNAYGCPKGQFNRKGRCLECPGAAEARGFIGINPKGQCTTKPGCRPNLRIESSPPNVLTKIGRPFTAKCTNLPKDNLTSVLKKSFKSELAAGNSLTSASKDFLREAKKSRAIKNAIKNKKPRDLVAAVRRLGSFQRLRTKAKQLGYKTVTVGSVFDVQLGVGANEEQGVAIDLEEMSAAMYTTTGVSVGLAAGVEAGFTVGYWKSNVQQLAGYGRGIATSVSATLSIGAAGWFTYEPTSYQGTSFSLGAGLGAEIGEMNATLTQVY